MLELNIPTYICSHKYDLLIKVFVMALSLKDRKFIRLGLPHGSQTEIAKQLGVTRMSINQYLNGKIYSKRIEEAIIERYELEKKYLEELRKRIYE